MWKETDVVSLKVTSWNLKGLNTTKDLRISGFPAKNPIQIDLSAILIAVRLMDHKCLIKHWAESLVLKV
jgi:hypothetical protein